MLIAMLANFSNRSRVAFPFAVILLSAGALGQVRDTNAKYIAIPHAHAHNDYEHRQPLFDALDQGFVSIEADIWLLDGELYVAHDKKGIMNERRLDNLYLQPLAELFRKSKGSIFTTEHALLLLIDIKSDGEQTYQVLQEVLEEYREAFSHHLSDGSPALMIVLSGNRPIEKVRGDRHRQVSIDGRIAEMNNEYGSLVTLVSENWRKHFSWNGTGMMPDNERSKLRAIVAKVHKANAKLRFWATPENENVWRVLREEGVDLIGTDQLQRLRLFLTSSK
jgi:hypothetical protein